MSMEPLLFQYTYRSSVAFGRLPAHTISQSPDLPYMMRINVEVEKIKETLGHEHTRCECSALLA